MTENSTIMAVKGNASGKWTKKKLKATNDDEKKVTEEKGKIGKKRKRKRKVGKKKEGKN